MSSREKGGRFSRKGVNVRLAITAGAAFLALILLVILAIGITTDFQLALNGGTEPITLVYGVDTYQEPGATATVNGKPVEVTISGTVDEEKLGTYEIIYQAKYLWFTETAKREVKVVDTTAPVITLVQTPGHTTPPGELYQEEGFTATDDYDGDITDKVQVTVEGDIVTYTVSDSSGNQTTQTREIVRSDIEAPVLTLKGDTKITLSAGGKYSEPGFTATDDRDGDITANVKVTGSVDVYRAGTYTITYTATDNAGNVTTAERTVVVKAIQQPSTQSPGDKVIYLTFDDGPSPHTQKLLDILAKYNAKATFFVVNTGYNMNTLLNNIVKGGHAIGIHSVSHNYEKIYASEEAFFNDLYGMQKIIKDKTGVTTTLMRFPGGSSNAVSKKYCKGIMTKLTKAVEDQGFQYFDWNVSSGDAGDVSTTDKVFNNVTKGIAARNGKYSIVLQHDLYKFSVEAVERILIWGIENGYTFKALDSSSPTAHHPVNN